jgi:hypothetical protein
MATFDTAFALCDPKKDFGPFKNDFLTNFCSNGKIIIPLENMRVDQFLVLRLLLNKGDEQKQTAFLYKIYQAAGGKGNLP